MRQVTAILLQRAKRFWSQCQTNRGWTVVDIERKLYKVICIGNLATGPRRGNQRCASSSLCSPFDKGIQTQVREPRGAISIAAPSEIE